jgi:hypothetical protein
MYPRVSLLLAYALLVNAECVQVGEIKYGTIEVIASDSRGLRIDSVSADLIESGSRKSVKSAFRDGVARVPYGEYLLRVQAPGFYTSEFKVRVLQSEMVVRAQLALGAECRGYSSIGGSIKSKSGERELWVKAIPLHGVGGSETRVGRYGTFLLAGLDSGEYLLIVLDGSSVVHTRAVKVAGEATVNIDL